ncbi:MULTISPECIES: gamma-glutamyltransferase [Alteromonas]|uniref:gamma-glutamyltransferase n=1 Tax=Alteromonas TaxID=226 RepID=UPI0012875F78|nr:MULTISPECIES: gamma-glutamyltransferase [Alteromonas]CAI2388594.1 gamma-glutamyltranspeptidase / glutathione hydrolase [Alteromonas macleodii]CAI3931308.1 gamma-glutamyltranspeptidase / glutathione hydrolase [Alteromonas macleodii]CAI3931455.1 gamma-glutamyltranspeptidase / glutathione hydrolase [Alteromonas macleodii]CAI3931481.1 gamma-glutamyltranspeptidase / glutathione hydrolase [Alteromonas macleodii]VTO38190.1 gamma-glutamyltranspeptidase / glutathione hydrolase [Alteromonas macleodii|tara:strand:+ start:449 stop:2167 length:1719 start_codon:yes stop_codon:yes gene_type:complete
MKKRIANIGFISVIVAFISVVAACSHAPNPPVDSASNNTVGLSQQAVAMPDSYSADAAMQVLQEGGNAIDAAITAQFVLAVTLPEAGNVGGGGFMTIKFEDSTDFLDYREMAPENAHRDMYLDEQGDVKPYESLFGAKASGIPGTVAGMWAAHKKYGTLDWERLLAPAVDLAEQGFVVHEKLANNIDHYIERTKEASINNNFSEYFAHAKAGTTFKQPELAKTLKAIQQQGKDGFYKGDVAKHIVDFMQQNGGLITYEDLLAYKAVWRKPLHLNWQGYELVTAPPPSSGGVAVAQWIGMLEAYDATHDLPAQNSTEYIHVMSEIGKRVFADRAEYMGDPDFVSVPVEALTDANYITQRAADIQPTSISDTPSVKPGLKESEDTTHFSIMDRWGNAVANTTTINLTFGSGVVVTGAGFLLNDEMDDFSAKPGVPNFFGAVGGEANAIEPYKRMLSSMTPTLVTKDDQVVLVTGSPGGTTIISSVTQSLLNALLYDMSAEEAVNSPRFHHQLLPKDTIRMHDGFTEATVNELKAMGYTIDNRRFGDVHLIKRTKEGVEAASEKSGRGKSLVQPY